MQQAINWTNVDQHHWHTISSPDEIPFMVSPNSGFYLTWLGWHVSSTQLISPLQSSIQVTQPSLSLCPCVTLDQCWPTSLTHLSFLVENESIKSSNSGLYFDMIKEKSLVNRAHQPNAARHPRHPTFLSTVSPWINESMLTNNITDTLFFVTHWHIIPY